MPSAKWELHCHSLSAHLQQLYTGFSVLHAQGAIDLSQEIGKAAIRYSSDAQHLGDAGHAHLTAVLDGRLKVHFDTHDAVEIADSALEDCDYYFKRSYSSDYVSLLPQKLRAKVFPLGLNYRVYPNAISRFAFRRNLALNIGYRNKVSGLNEVLDTKNRWSFKPRLSDLEDRPDLTAVPRVLFLTMLYDPHDDPCRSKEKIEERHRINQKRVQCIRLLRKELGNAFLGGLKDTEYALQHYRDLVVTDNQTTKQCSYIKLMKSFPICVASTGLHNSTGWKLAEYVACAKAIVSERLMYEVPGNFAPGSNYLEFTSAEECVSNALQLMADKELRATLMINNSNYYRYHLRPDVLVGNALNTALKQRHAQREHAANTQLHFVSDYSR